MWTLLLATLPSRPNAVRLRVWRAVKTLGCAALRDGAYLLPASQAAALDALADEVRAHGGSASVLALSARSPAQEAEWRALFDRSEAYAAWRTGVLALQTALPTLAEAPARRRLRLLAEDLAALQRIDHLPGAAAAQAEADLAHLRAAVDAAASPGEPRARAPGAVRRLDPARFQGRAWATRARPRVDRLACAWLIRRFIDTQASFVWLGEPVRTPRGALGFDFDGARFTHVGALVSFEVLCASFGLDENPALRRIGALVRCLDAGGIPVPEAAGLGAVLEGLRALHADDDRLVRAAAAVFDALYATPQAAA